VITDILLPYVIMETIWTLLQFAASGTLALNPTTPSWTLWFLLALGIFRLVLPYLALIRWPLLWAIVFSVGVGYLTNVDSTFSLSRAIGILPFFVLGWKLKEWGLVDRWRLVERQTVPARLIAAGVLVAWGRRAHGLHRRLARDGSALLVLLRRFLRGARRGPVVGGRRAPAAHRARDAADGGRCSCSCRGTRPG